MRVKFIFSARNFQKFNQNNKETVIYAFFHLNDRIEDFMLINMV